jgi:hypothetical protein
VSFKRDIQPGDLVIEFSSKNNGPTRANFALVIGVTHPRGGDHIGCEPRIRVLWSKPLGLDEVCDCEVIVAEAF